LGTGFDGWRMVWEVKDNRIKSACELDDGLDAFFDGALNVVVSGAFTPCSGGASEVLKGDFSMLSTGLNGDMDSTLPDDALDVHRKASTANAGFQYRVVGT
jgi:hypothetical protein